MSLQYDAVALGMGAYTRAAFSVHTLGADVFSAEPGTIIFSTHRRETDVPLLCPSMYRAGRLWASRPRISFAARDDIFARGFFAGFPRNLSPRARKALYGIRVGGALRYLPWMSPIRSATMIRLGDVLREVPAGALDELLPRELAAVFRERASSLGHPGPTRGADVLRGEYADLLWRKVRRPDLAERPELEGLWSRQAALAGADFRRLVDVVRGGGALMLFPEGRPSPDGRIGPVRPGLTALVRRARPVRLQPVGIAYDPLVRRRTRAYVSFLPPVEPPTDGLEDAVLALMRLAVPLTCGQVVARHLSEGESAPRRLEDQLARAVEEARAEGRNFDVNLADPRVRRRRVAEAVEAAASRGREVAYLAREHAAARGETL